MKKTIVFIAFLFLSLEVLAMSFFNPGKTCVFSEVRARLALNGKPLKNVTVIRRWEWKEPREDRTVTDEDGYFEFPSVYESSVSRMLPVEVVIGQEIYAVIDGSEKKIWANAKQSPDENSELKGRPIKLSCDISNSMEVHGSFGLLQTLCSWEE